MSNDDHSDEKPRQGRGNTNKTSRNSGGRWLPGCRSPNPKGRPKKKPKVVDDQSDLYVFGNTMIDVVTNGQIEMMDRREALLNKIYESAMKGKVTSQRFLYKEFGKNDERLAGTRLHYDQLMMKWYVNNTGKNRVDVPIEIELDIMNLRRMLNYYFPGSYPPNGYSTDEDADDE